VVSKLEMDDLTDVILVGHSYGGLVIRGAAERAWKRFDAYPLSSESRGLLAENLALVLESV
jgi:pimeloyl-ACP methyl ester carboxylesterase